MRDFREPASTPCAYMRGLDRAAGHLLQGHSQGRPQGRQTTPSARHAHLQASCYCCERPATAEGCQLWRSRMRPPLQARTCAFAAEPAAAAVSARRQPRRARRGAALRWQATPPAENRVVKFAKSGVTAPPTISAMTARLNGSSVEAARRYERPCRRPCKGHAKGTSCEHGRKCMAQGSISLSGSRMYAQGLDTGFSVTS